jgi:hypothetical protein
MEQAFLSTWFSTDTTFTFMKTQQSLLQLYLYFYENPIKPIYNNISTFMKHNQAY